MEGQKPETQEKAETHPNLDNQQASATKPKTKTPKSKLRQWMKLKYIKNKFSKDKGFFRNPDPPVAKILSKIVRRDNRYHLVSTRTASELFKRKNIDPLEESPQALLTRLEDIETKYGVELSVKKLSPKKYRCKVSGSISKYLPFSIKGNELLELSDEKTSRALLSQSSKVKCPIDEVDIEDVTSYADHPANPLQNVLYSLRNRFYPTVIRYHYNDERLPLKKVLLVHLPNSLNAYQLSTLYGMQLTETQTEFYPEKRERGATKGDKMKTKLRIRRAARKLAMTITGFASMGRNDQYREINKETDIGETYIPIFLTPLKDAIEEADRIHTIWKEERDSLLSMTVDERCEFLAKRLLISQAEFKEEFLPYVEIMIDSNRK